MTQTCIHCGAEIHRVDWTGLGASFLASLDEQTKE